MNTLSPNSAPVRALLVVVLLTAGCREKADSRLLGEWVGKPDTAEARAERQAEKYEDASVASLATGSRAEKTDWEIYNVTLRFNFVSEQRLEMSREDGSEPVAGTWEVSETTPTGCTIEVLTPSEGDTDSQQMRRFRLEFDEREGQLVGFLLNEVGADRNLGALYFSRAP